MKKETRILVISGDNGDFEAMEYEQHLKRTGETHADFWNEADADGGGYMEIQDQDGEQLIIHAEAKVYGAIDMEFISFVLSDMCDSDSLKGSCFYVVEDK